MTNFQQYDKIIVAAAFFQQVAPHTKYYTHCQFLVFCSIYAQCPIYPFLIDTQIMAIDIHGYSLKMNQIVIKEQIRYSQLSDDRQSPQLEINPKKIM